MGNCCSSESTYDDTRQQQQQQHQSHQQPRPSPHKPKVTGPGRTLGTIDGQPTIDPRQKAALAAQVRDFSLVLLILGFTPY